MLEKYIYSILKIKSKLSIAKSKLSINRILVVIVRKIKGYRIEETSSRALDLKEFKDNT